MADILVALAAMAIGKVGGLSPFAFLTLIILNTFFGVLTNYGHLTPSCSTEVLN